MLFEPLLCKEVDPAAARGSFSLLGMCLHPVLSEGFLSGKLQPVPTMAPMTQSWLWGAMVPNLPDSVVVQNVNWIG